MHTHLPRLDILIYAHDGRGLGHAGRSIGVGMAVRRLYPELKVLFVSGCKVSRELIGDVPLDWLKLPAYETEVIGGKSRGVDGHSGFTDRDLGEIRAAELQHLVTLYRPRIVLCDHTPQGKHRELIPALKASVGCDTRWVLGVRGVVGGVRQVQSDLAGTLFEEHYRELLWYGDSEVLGTQHITHLQDLFGSPPVECGYVSRLSELCRQPGTELPGDVKLAGTVAIPWLGEESLDFLRKLSEALAGIAPDYGRWQLFVDSGTPEVQREIQGMFAPLAHCRLDPPGGRNYVAALLHSRSALVYGGYNSLMDVLYAKIPALVVLRGMQDNEQQIHLDKLVKQAGNQLSVLAESGATVADLQRTLLQNLQTEKASSPVVNLNGAATAAIILYKLLRQGD